MWINRTIVDSSVRATTLSMVSQADAVGQVVGGPAIGGLATAVSLRAGLAVGALMLVPAALLTRTARSRLAAPESAPNDCLERRTARPCERVLVTGRAFGSLVQRVRYAAASLSSRSSQSEAVASTIAIVSMMRPAIRYGSPCEFGRRSSR